MPKRATEQPEASRNAEMKHGLYFRPSSRFSKTFQICQIPPLLFIYSPKDLCGIPMSQSTKGQFDEIHGIHGIHRARRARLARAALADSKLFRCRRSWSIASTPVWGHPFMARWFMLISWKILENQKKMITGGTPMTKRKPPYTKICMKKFNDNPAIYSVEDKHQLQQGNLCFFCFRGLLLFTHPVTLQQKLRNVSCKCA